MAGLLAIGKIAIKGASLLFDAAVNAANKPPEDPPKTQRQRDLEKDLLKWAQRHARTLEEIERMKSLTVAVVFFGLIILAIVVSRTHYM